MSIFYHDSIFTHETLHFYVNGQEDPDALDKVISPNDLLRVEYR